jgi:hypothetical protein
MEHPEPGGSDPAAEPSPPPPPARSRADFRAASACAAVGLLLAIAPHLTMLARTGGAEYLADDDDILYLAIGRIPYHGESALRDPFSSRSDRVPSLFAWLQFVPLAWLTRLLGLPPILMSLVWRAVGGVALGASVWLLFRRLLAGTSRPTAWALGCSLIALADPGLVLGRPLVDSGALVLQMASGTTPMGKADALAQYRVVTPLLNLPLVLLLAACLHPAAPDRRRAALAGVALLGLCFLIYFYFWTAAVVALGGYLATLLSLALWGGPRRPEHLARARLVATVLIGGALLGAPQVLANARTFADPAYQPILHRLGRGCPVPTGDRVRSMYLPNTWAWGKIAAGAIALGIFRMRGLGLVWWLTVAGFALANSALVTGLEFENFHWSYVFNTFGEVLLLAIAARGLDRWPGRHWRPWLWLVPIATLAIAAVWRPYEALTAPEAVASTRVLRELRGLRPALEGLGPEAVLAGTPEARLALLYTRGGLLFEAPYTAHNSLIPDEEVSQRHALNAWLAGLDLSSYRRAAMPPFPYQAVPIDVPRWRPEAIARRRVAIFASLLRGDGDALLRRFHPDALLLPATAPAPERGGPWRRLAATREWALWVKAPSGAAG